MSGNADLNTPPLRGWRFFVDALMLGMLLVSCVFVCGCGRSKPPAELLAEARLALKEDRSADVESLVDQMPRSAPEWQSAMLVAGEAAAKQKQFEAAIRHYLDAAEDASTSDGQLALFSAAEVYFELGQLTDAERLYREVLELQPKNGITNQRMAFLLSLTNRRWEALDHFFVLIRGGDATYRELGMAADVSRQIRQPDFLEKCNRQNPNGKLVRLAIATDAFHEGQPEAKSLLKELTAEFPDLIPAQAMLGELLVEPVNLRAFVEWHDTLPASADDSPDIWFVRGVWARNQSDLETAADCFWQVVTRMPFHRRGFTALGQVLTILEEPQATAIVDYAALLVDVSQTVDKVLVSNGKNLPAIADVAGLMEQLGRIWEACAWAVVGRHRSPQATWHAEIFRRHAAELTPNLPGIVAKYNPAASRVRMPVPAFADLVDRVSERLAAKTAPRDSSADISSQVHFRETNLIPFVYHNADDPATKGVRTFEQTGGGVAIVDLDLDHAPDIFLPQGTVWKTGSSTPDMTGEFIDGLFRNQAGAGFQDISHQLTGADSGYGQGCAVGDFDNDGFPDLYVANIGRNGLYRNLGDGTFENVTADAQISDTSWTASAVFCDLNADGMADLYDVNYLTGKDVYEKICADRACSPSVFPGAQDRLLINQGNGRFELAADATPTTDSKGLGAVAFETDVPRRPMLFIANDQVANFFLVNHASPNGFNIALKNEAITTGLAYNDHGLPMACMGVAVDDLDGNNLLDIFITNFQDESNTVYLQNSPGLYSDATRAIGMQAVSLPYTSWGTQTLDADNDGWPDVVVTSGHVDDGRDYGGDYHQRSQFFRNVDGVFVEPDPNQVGSWFTEKRLGRGLARVDWNRDGRPEFVVSNMNETVSVMQNTSTSTGQFLNVRLHARTTARDAIGARVTLARGERDVTRQLLAGDGYMASNERVVSFGLGDQSAVDRLSVQWPSGATSTVDRPTADATYTIVEGSTVATVSRESVFSSASVIVTKAEP